MRRWFRWCAVATTLVTAALIIASDRDVTAQESQRPEIVPAPALTAIEGVNPSDDEVLRALASSSEAHEIPGEYVPGRVLVKFRDGAGGTTAQTHAATLQRAGARISQIRTPEYADFSIVEISADADAEAVASTLSRESDVAYAQPDYRVFARYKPNDPDYARQWNFPAIGMEEAWDINRGASSSVIVAVLDSGMAYLNAMGSYNTLAVRVGNLVYPSRGRITVPFAAAPDLVSADRIVAPRDFIWNSNTPVDFQGHGTHVAGTIGQLTDNGAGGAGMAFNVKLMPVKVISNNWDFYFGAVASGTDSVIAQGIRYAVDNGARVLNMSIGRGGTPAPVMEDALRYAVSHGAFVAISAGNDYEDGNPTEQPAEIAGRIDGVMCVAAIGRDMNRAYYSGVKPYVEIAAPGGNVRVGSTSGLIFQQTNDPTLGYNDPFSILPSQYRAPRFDVFVQSGYQGTSMAAPHVAGLAALLMQQGITNPAAIEAAIKRFATDRGPAGRDDEYGYGVINPRATLRGLGLTK